SAQIREILISESAWEEMTCLFAPSLVFISNYALNLSRARDILKPQKSEPPKLTHGIDSVPPELTSRYTL
ncbi:hypothetical protein V8996_26925, partial [Klebsiella pneumoniae]